MTGHQGPHVVIVGPMGAGKTTIGELLADALSWPFADSDAHIEATEGVGAPEVAATEGVAGLHDLERDALLSALTADEPTVIAAAASVVDHAQVLASLGDQFTVWIDASPQVSACRVREGGRRAVTEDKIRHLDARRRPLYEQVADLRVSAESTPAAIIDEILELLPVS